MHGPDTGEGGEKEQASVAGRRQAAKVQNTRGLDKVGRVGGGKLINNSGEGEHGLTRAKYSLEGKMIKEQLEQIKEMGNKLLEHITSRCGT